MNPTEFVHWLRLGYIDLNPRHTQCIYCAVFGGNYHNGHSVHQTETWLDREQTFPLSNAFCPLNRRLICRQRKLIHQIPIKRFFR